MWKTNYGMYRLRPDYDRRIKGKSVIAAEKFDYRTGEWFFYSYGFAKLPVVVNDKPND